MKLISKISGIYRFSKVIDPRLMGYYVFGVAVLVFLTSLSLYQINNDRKREIHNQHTQLRIAEQRFQDKIKEITFDLHVIADSSLIGTLLNQKDLECQKQTDHFLKTFIHFKKEIGHINVIDTSGALLAGVYSDKNHITGYSKTNHQTTGLDLGYPEEVFRLKPGATYIVSHVSKRPKFKKEFADESVIYFAKSVPDKLGKKSGSVVIAFRPNSLLEAMRETAAASSSSMELIDRDGFSFVVPGRDDALGYAATPDELRMHTTFRSRFPAIWTRIQEEQNGTVLLDGRLFAYASIQAQNQKSERSLDVPGDEGEVPLGTLVSITSKKHLNIKKNRILKVNAFIFSTFFIFSVCLLMYLTKRRENLQKIENTACDPTLKIRSLDEEMLRSTAALFEKNQKLENSNLFLSHILEKLDGIIYVSDFETHEILYTNQYLKDLFGLDPTGQKCYQFIHSCLEGSCSFCSKVKFVDEEGKSGKVFYKEFQSPFDKKWYSAKYMAIPWENRKLARLEIAIDITAQKQLEVFLKEARKQAERSLLTKNKFVALVAHDLKSPFLSILGMLKSILEKESFTHKVHKKYLENIINNGHRMLKMIDNLLAMDRLENREIQPDCIFFDIAEMIDEVIENFTHLAHKKEVYIHNRIPMGTEIFADRYLYFVVVNNLISNAVKYSYQGGDVNIEIPDSERSNTLAVHDTGRGIQENMLKDLFNPEVKTSLPGTLGEKGTGLGLLLCQEILKAHGGSLMVKSTEKKGAIFFIELPGLCKYPKNLDS